MAEVSSNMPPPASPAPNNSMAEVQAELQEYLKEKDLNAIFVDIVENLLVKKPENPIDFIVKYLFNKYPDETKSSAPVSSPVAPIHEEPSRSDDKSIESESDSDSDEDSDEDLAPLDRPAKPPTIGKVRRNSVCAEELNVKTFMQSSDVKNIPKSDEEAERIRHILKKNMLFQHLDEEQLLTVQNAMFLVEKENGDVIIQQGDDGDNFYILDQGRVNVFLEPKDTSSLEVEQNPDELSSTTPENETDDSKQDENYCTAEGDNTMEKEQDKGKKPVCTYEDGDFFGELAIMYNAPRAATCIADGPVKLWALDRVSFKVILMQTTIEKRNTHKEFLKKVPLLSELTEYELLTFADSLQEEIFKDGETICKEGNNGEKFYIIKEGTAICLKTNSTSGEEYEVATLSNGSYFGEIALITTKSRQATVRASGNLKCLCLDRKTFKRVMGPMVDILMRNIESYNKFQAANI